MKGKQRIFNYINKNFKNKKFLFLENDYDLYRELAVIENFLIDKKIKYHTICNFAEMSTKGILEMIDFSDVIIWQSTYVDERTQQLLGLINNYPDKIFIEVSMNEPFRYYKGDLIPDVYILNGMEDEFYDDSWTFHKLSDKPLWNKKFNEI